MVNYSARASSGGQRESFSGLNQALPSRYNKGVWCVGKSPTQPVGFAVEVGEEVGQNPPTATCLVLPDSVPSVQVAPPQPREDMAGNASNSALHHVLNTFIVDIIKPPNNPTT